MAQTVAVRSDDIAGSLAEAVAFLPGFNQASDGWEEPDVNEFPGVGAHFFGEVEGIDVTIAKTRDGFVRLSLVFAVEPENEWEEAVSSGVLWLFPGSIDPEKFGTSGLPVNFLAEGCLNDILNCQPLLRTVFQLNALLDRLLIGDPKQFMRQTATYRLEADGDQLPDGEIAGSVFMRLFVLRVALAGA